MVGHTTDHSSGQRYWFRHAVSVWYRHRNAGSTSQPVRNETEPRHWIDHNNNHTYEEIQINSNHINLLIKEGKVKFKELNKCATNWSPKCY